MGWRQARMQCTQKGSDASPRCRLCKNGWASVGGGGATHQVLCARPSGHNAEEDVPTRGGLVHPYLPAKCRQSQWNKRNKGRKKLAQQVSKSVANANKKQNKKHVIALVTQAGIGRMARDKPRLPGYTPCVHARRDRGTAPNSAPCLEDSALGAHVPVRQDHVAGRGSANVKAQRCSLHRGDNWVRQRHSAPRHLIQPQRTT
jgi:hypothetical protein